MPSEQEFINKIKQVVTDLRLAYSAVQFWYPRQTRHITQEYEQSQAQLQERLQQRSHKITTHYQEKVTPIQQQTEAIIQHMGYTAFAWSDSAWQEKVADACAIRCYTSPYQDWSINRKKSMGAICLPGANPYHWWTQSLFKATSSGKENARLVIQSIMLRLLATLPPGKLRFTCLDPVGLGATVAGLIKDYLTS